MMDKPDWLIEYKATEAFNVSDVSPQSLHSLVQTFEPRGSLNFGKYYLYNSVSAGTELCEDECKTAQICGITKIDFEEYDECLELPAKSATASIGFSPTTAAFFLFYILFHFPKLS